jgi:RNA polymerase sigma factor (sigma-70 family)
MSSLNGGLDEASDEELVALSKDGASKAFDVLVKRHWLHVVNIARKHFQEEEDVAQIVFIEAWRKIHLYSPGDGHSFMGWIVTMASRRTIDLSRRRKAYSMATERAEAHFARFHTTSYERTEEFQDSEILDKAIRRLPVEQAEVIQLVRDGCSQREIATITRTPLGTVKTRIGLGLKKLQRTTSVRELAT